MDLRAAMLKTSCSSLIKFGAVTYRSKNGLNLSWKVYPKEENLVKFIPSTAVLYSSIVGVLPRTADNTTTGASKDSPFSLDILDTLLKYRVDVASTVSPFAAFS